ncbi:MAG: C-GCAxxG-C-C family protein [Candidatus Lokiarchaeota archaeon]
MDNVQKALNYFNSRFNCAQSVFAAFSEELGLETSKALKIASGFGGGLARNGKTCGAVTGALMAIGLKYGHYKENDQVSNDITYESVNNFISEFSKKHGTIECKELLGIDISNQEGLEKAKKLNYFESKCPNFVKDAATIVSEIFNNTIQPKHGLL